MTKGAEDFLVSFFDLDEGAEDFKYDVAWVAFHAVASEIVKAFSAADCFLDCQYDLVEASSPPIPRVSNSWIQSDSLLELDSPRSSGCTDKPWADLS